MSASTQTQSLSAIRFLYRHVLSTEIGRLEDVVRARRPQRLPVVMSRGEVREALERLSGREWLGASLMYGAGLRLTECLRLRVQAIDFERGEITIRDGKGGKDRLTMLPESVKSRLRAHLQTVRTIHERDLREG